MRTLNPDDIMKKGDIAMDNNDETYLIVNGYAGSQAKCLVGIKVKKIVRIETSSEMIGWIMKQSIPLDWLKEIKQCEGWEQLSLGKNRENFLRWKYG